MKRSPLARSQLPPVAQLADRFKYMQLNNKATTASVRVFLTM